MLIAVERDTAPRQLRHGWHRGMYWRAVRRQPAAESEDAAGSMADPVRLLLCHVDIQVFIRLAASLTVDSAWRLFYRMSIPAKNVGQANLSVIFDTAAYPTAFWAESQYGIVYSSRHYRGEIISTRVAPQWAQYKQSNLYSNDTLDVFLQHIPESAEYLCESVCALFGIPVAEA